MSPGIIIVFKVVAVILLIVSMGCFGYGAWRLVDEIVFRANSVPVQGEVVGSRDRHEQHERTDSRGFNARSYTVTVTYPVVRFRSPVDGRLHRVTSSRALQPGEQPGAKVELRASTRAARDGASDGRVPNFSKQFLLPAVLLLGGLAAMAIVIMGWSLLLAADPASSMLGALRGLPVAAVVALLPVTLWWTLSERALAFLICHPPALAAAMRAEPPGPGQLLSPSELRIARLPVYGRKAANAAVQLAIEERRHEDLRRYLRAYRDPALRFPVEFDGGAPFDWAASIGDVEAARLVLEAGLDARPKQELLEDAVETGREEFVRLLAAKGVGPQDDEVRRSLARTATRSAEYDSMLITLLELGWVRGEPFPPNRLGLLDEALLVGMVRASAELERRGYATTSPLLARLTQGDLAGMRAVLPEAKWATERIGKAPLLMWAAQAGQLAVVRRLVELGADPAARTGMDHKPQQTALDLAARHGRLDVVRYLARLPGARSYVEPQSLTAPVVYAATEERWDVVQALIDAGASPNVREVGDRYWGTPLHIAARKGNAAALAYLLAHGADPLAEGEDKLLPIEVAEDSAVRAAIEAAGGRGP